VSASRVENERDLVEQRRRNRRLRLLLAGTGALFCWRSLPAVSHWGSVLRPRSRRESLAHELGAEAVSEPRIDRAMLLAREAIDLDNSRQTAGTLLATLLRSPSALGTISSPITDRPQQIALSPDGKTLSAVENTGLVRFYDTGTRRERGKPLPNAPAFPATFTKDGKLVLLFRAPSKTAAPAIEVLDAHTLKHLRFLPLDKRWLSTFTSGAEPLLAARQPLRLPRVLRGRSRHSKRRGWVRRSLGPAYGKAARDAGSGLERNVRRPRHGERKPGAADRHRCRDAGREDARRVRSKPVRLPYPSSMARASLAPDGQTVATAG
jgi:hypothetical protein